MQRSFFTIQSTTNGYNVSKLFSSEKYVVVKSVATSVSCQLQQIFHPDFAPHCNAFWDCLLCTKDTYTCGLIILPVHLREQNREGGDAPYEGVSLGFRTELNITRVLNIRNSTESVLFSSVA